MPAQRDALIDFARDTLNLSTRAALSTEDISLPDQYGGEIRELISEFGVVRRQMSPYRQNTETTETGESSMSGGEVIVLLHFLALIGILVAFRIRRKPSGPDLSKYGAVKLTDEEWKQLRKPNDGLGKEPDHGM